MSENWFACPRCGYWYKGDYYETSKTCPKCTKLNGQNRLLNKWNNEEIDFEEKFVKEHNDKYYKRV